MIELDEPFGIHSVAYRPLVGLWIRHRDHGGNRTLTDFSRAGFCGSPGMRRALAPAAHQTPVGTFSDGNHYLTGFFGQPCRRTSADSQILCLPRIAGDFFAAAKR